MKQQVLKALANPAHIFYVPYSLAILNFVVWFLLYIAIFVAFLIVPPTGDEPSPLWFMFVVIITHSIIAVFSRRDPQLGQIITAKIQLFKHKVPKKLAA